MDDEAKEKARLGSLALEDKRKPGGAGRMDLSLLLT